MWLTVMSYSCKGNMSNALDTILQARAIDNGAQQYLKLLGGPHDADSSRSHDIQHIVDGHRVILG